MIDRMICAIGDVHGEAARLRALHRAILDHHRYAAPRTRLKIVHLGDYVDRGSDSKGVIETLMEIEENPAIDVVNLMGNHEEMLLEWHDADCPGDDHVWLSNGGETTLCSYTDQSIDGLPESHIAWLRDLPTIHYDEQARLIFVHAGLDPATFPDDNPARYLWTRSRRFFDVDQWENPALKGWCVVHGHTPTHNNEPEIAGTPPKRINLDTGAVFGGPLTAAVFRYNEPMIFLRA